MILTCSICNKEFNCAPSRLKRAVDPPCCSRFCANLQKQQKQEINCECDFCHKKFHRKKSQLIKNIKYNYCSEDCLAQHRKILYKGINNPNAFSRIPPNNKILRCGYYWIYMPQHPLSTKSGYIREHRLVAEQYLLTEENSIIIDQKKYLNPKFDVHHKDFNKLNNVPNNLQILSRSEHQKLHQQLKNQFLKEHNFINSASLNRGKNLEG